jgi:hypothetical protein
MLFSMVFVNAVRLSEQTIENFIAKPSKEEKD